VKLDTEYILGMAKVKSKVVTLLDIENVLTHDELVKLINM
jgi:chemotaxis signal transduction protein